MVCAQEEGLQLQREQQEKLVDYWLKQHDTVKQELQSLLTMANAASQVTTNPNPKQTLQPSTLHIQPSTLNLQNPQPSTAAPSPPSVTRY